MPNINPLTAVNTHTLPGQAHPVSPQQVRNNAGGYTFHPTAQQLLERFLILGTYGGTYYVSEKQFTQDNVDFIRHMVQTREEDVIETLTRISVEGRAYRNAPVLFTLAMVFAVGKNKTLARETLPLVARTSTHLFEFAQYVDNLSGWGRAKRRAVADWYTTKTPQNLAYQLVKYRQRNGWTHRDMLRLSHPTGLDPDLAGFILGKPFRTLPPIVEGYLRMRDTTTAQDALTILDNRKYQDLPWETIPTAHLTDARIWKTLFRNKQLTGQALLRNVTRLAKLGTFADNEFREEYIAALTNRTMIQKTRLHPINYLNAAVAYTEGTLNRRTSHFFTTERTQEWDVHEDLADALTEGFHAAFTTIQPAGKRTLIALDVSSSMEQPALGIDLSCAQVGAAVAMTVAKTEPDSTIVGFTSKNIAASTGWWVNEPSLVNLGINAATTLPEAMKKIREQTFGGTDCALPMMYAAQNGIPIDTFVVITDCETWAGNLHPHEALRQYRHMTGIPARLAVLGVASNGFTIADPDDAGMLDVVGFDADCPKILTDFSAKKI